MTSDSKTRQLMSGLLICIIAQTNMITQLMNQILSADEIAKIAAHVNVYNGAVGDDLDIGDEEQDESDDCDASKEWMM
jgi:hypothetical protein